jgi:uncharacterized protein YbaA (DUF1428 family)
MSYVDGFVLAVPKANREIYRARAALAAEVLKELGALHVMEAWGDEVPRGKRTDFYRAVEAEEDEVIVFSWVLWPSREARDRGNERLLQDPRMQLDDATPFDGKRLIHGGFVPLVDL